MTIEINLHEKLDHLINAIADLNLKLNEIEKSFSEKIDSLFELPEKKTQVNKISFLNKFK